MLGLYSAIVKKHAFPVSAAFSLCLHSRLTPPPVSPLYPPSFLPPSSLLPPSLLPPSLPPPSSLLPPSSLPHPSLQGVVGTENSLKSALVTVFTDGELDLEGDETGTEEMWDVQTESTPSLLTPLSNSLLSPSLSFSLSPSLPTSIFLSSLPQTDVQKPNSWWMGSVNCC